MSEQREQEIAQYAARHADSNEAFLFRLLYDERAGTRAAVVKALNHARTLVWDDSGELAAFADAIENGADW